jgi:hypothetical protein
MFDVVVAVETIGVEGIVIAAEGEMTWPDWSVTVTEYEPAADKPVMEEVVRPLLHT